MTKHKTIPGIGGRRFIVRDAAGHELEEGDTVKTFRGEEAQLLRIDAAPIPGKSAKVGTTLGTHYASVYDVTVTLAPAATLTEVMEALDALSEAARIACRESYRAAADRARYCAALVDARCIGITDEQILDAYRWGRRDLGPAEFDHRGHVLGEEENAHH